MFAGTATPSMKGPSGQVQMSDPYLYHGVQLERRGFFKAWSIYGMGAIEVAPESPDMNCSRRRIRTDFASRGSSRATGRVVWGGHCAEAGRDDRMEGTLERTGYEGMFVTFYVWLVRVSNCFREKSGDVGFVRSQYWQDAVPCRLTP